MPTPIDDSCFKGRIEKESESLWFRDRVTELIIDVS